jgi:rare lipoprotein A (peptidoglycan hydrolase)
MDVANGGVIDYQPPQPSPDHEWNADARRWDLSAAAAERIGRRAQAASRIEALERAQARPIRELAIDPSNAEARKRLEAIEGEIASLRDAARPR